MAKVQPVNVNRSYINSKTTGYGALCGVCLTGLSKVGKNNPLKNGHKYFGLLTAVFAIAHLYTVSNVKNKIENLIFNLSGK